MKSNLNVHTKLSTKEQRQILYAALLRYAPEAGSLRDKALDRFVLAALLDSNKSKPMTTAQVQEQTVLTPNSPGLRANVIEETLERLVNDTRVAVNKNSADQSYFLTESGEQYTNKATESAAQLFKPVLDRMLRDTEGLFSAKEGERVCRTFISECFARFGHQIAKAVIGDLASDGSFSKDHIANAFDVAIKTVSVSIEATKSLRSRCNRFLHSSEPDDKDLRFRLAQSYYVVQLLELSPQDFNPLADDAFSGAIFYLDTNVVLDAVMSEESSRRFREVITASKSIGIELVVTNATLHEAVSVASQRMDDIEKIIGTVPSKLLERTRDDFFLAFQKASASDPGISTTEFLVRFEELPSLMQKLAITIDPRSADEISNGQNVQRECQIVSNAAERIRGWGKSDQVSLHDVCHFMAVREQRRKVRKSWFLTRDRTLGLAAVKLAPEERPFCFPLLAFLQSVSPFLETPATRHSLADVFSAVLEGEVADLSGQSLFDVTELRLLAELHEDVLALPEDQLVPALDFVKANLLQGKPLRREDHTAIALELKKFVVSRAHERQEELLAQLAEQELRSSRAQQVVQQLSCKIEHLENKVGAVEAQNLAKERNSMGLGWGLVVLGLLFANVCWWIDLDIAQRVASIFPVDSVDPNLISRFVRILGSIAFIGSIVPILLKQLKRKIRVLGLTIVIAIAVGVSDLFGLSTFKAISAYLAVAAPCALVIQFLFGRNGKSG